MNGYFNRPELNEQRQAGGWHHTNDLGRIESDGSLTFIGPKTRLIKSAAENIYPTEVEGCLKQHPAVADAAVIGVPTPRGARTSPRWWCCTRDRARRPRRSSSTAGT